MSREPLSKLSEELRATIRAIGPCTGREAWVELRSRIQLARILQRPEMSPDFGDADLRFDPAGVPWIPEADLEAALLEAEVAGGIGCRNTLRSGLDEEYSWRPMLPVVPVDRQTTLF